jgi:hypothetical protein
MSPLDPLEILQVIGYSIGALLPLWMLFQLVTHRSKLSSIERILALLALTMGGWHTSNLVFTVSSISASTHGPRCCESPTPSRSSASPSLTHSCFTFTCISGPTRRAGHR